MRAWVRGINNKLPAKSCAVVNITEIYNATWGPAAGKLVA
jgi:ferritin-like protein